VQAGAGIRLHAKPGEVVRRGQPLMTLLSDDEERFARARESLEGGVIIAPEGDRPDQRGIVFDRIA
jgi:thymidine phosphorylase